MKNSPIKLLFYSVQAKICIKSHIFKHIMSPITSDHT